MSTFLKLTILPAMTAVLCIPSFAEKTVTVYSSGQKITSIFESVAKEADVIIKVDPSITGTLDLSLKQFPFTGTMNAVASAANLSWEKAAEQSSGKDVYLVHRKGAAAKAETPKPDATDTAIASKEVKKDSTKVSFAPSDPFAKTPEELEKEKQAQEVMAAAQKKPLKTRELHLNAAQIRMVLGGVPNMKANSILQMWRQRSMGGGQFYSPNGNSPYNNGFQYGNQYPYNNGYNPYQNQRPADVKYYMPDGSVWGGMSGPQFRISGPTKTK